MGDVGTRKGHAVKPDGVRRANPPRRVCSRKVAAPWIEGVEARPSHIPPPHIKREPPPEAAEAAAVRG